MTPERYDALKYCFASDPEALHEVEDGALLIAERTGVSRHHMLVTLGSGLADVAQDLGRVRCSIALADLPGVPVPTAEGQGGELLSIDVNSSHLLVATGRSHLYEGLVPATIVRLSQIAAATGIEGAVLTNAGGCLEQWQLGDVVVISDHVNFSGNSPFSGASFVDIWQMWDAQYRQAMAPYADHEGVYALLRGPEYQTRAESVLLRGAGVSMVGMSTVLEAIALHQLGVRVCGLSVVSDLSFAQGTTSHSDVLAAMRSAQDPVRQAVLAVEHLIGADA